MRVCFSVVVGVCVAACGAFAKAQPSIIELPGIALDVSNDGSTAVGRMPVVGEGLRAYRWTQDGGVENLGTLGGVHSMAYAVNADGSAVTGWSHSDSGQRAFRWTISGGMQDLGTLGDTSSIGQAISADGMTIAGSTFQPAHAFRWTASDGMQGIGPLEPVFASANDVSGDGSVVVGIGHTSDGFGRAVRWTAGEGMQELSSLSSTALAVTDDGGMIAGFASGVESGIFRWNSSTEMQEIGLNGIDPLQFEISPYDLSMSADGRVMGGSGIDWTVLPHSQNRAWLWTESSGLTLLEPYLAGLGVDLTGWELHEVTGLSFDGSIIVGTGTFEGAERSWMVSGVPSPGGSALVTIGLATVSRRRRSERGDA